MLRNNPLRSFVPQSPSGVCRHICPRFRRRNCEFDGKTLRQRAHSVHRRKKRRRKPFVLLCNLFGDISFHSFLFHSPHYRVLRNDYRSFPSKRHGQHRNPRYRWIYLFFYDLIFEKGDYGFSPTTSFFVREAFGVLPSLPFSLGLPFPFSK